MPNQMAAYRLAVAAGEILPPAVQAPPIPQTYIDQVVAREATAVHQEMLSLAATGGGVIMYDSTNVNAIPSNAALVASYVDGYGGYSAAVAKFGAAKCVSISVHNSNADVADVEPGAMSVGQLPAWVARQKARGIVRPVIYSDGSDYPSCAAAAGPSCSYWTARPTGQVVQTLPGRDAVQGVFAGSYDESWVLPTFPFYPGAPSPTPPPPSANPWPLSQGSTGPNVVLLQKNLNKWASKIGLSPVLTADGNFGSLTKAAVQKAFTYWHYNAGTVAAGVVDGSLWNHLLASPVPTPPPPPPPPPPPHRTITGLHVTYSDGTSVNLP